MYSGEFSFPNAGSPRSEVGADEKSANLSSEFFDSPRNYVYSESSANDTYRFPVSKSLGMSKLKEVSFAKGNDLKAALQSDRPLSLTVELLNQQIEQIEREVVGAFKSLSQRLGLVEDSVRGKGSEESSAKEELLNVKTQIKQIQLRIEKAELENTDSTIDSRKHQRQSDERVATLERKEAAKLRLFEELGNEIDSIKSIISEGLQSEGLKSMFDNLRLRQEKHDKMLATFQKKFEDRSQQVTLPMREEIKTLIMQTLTEFTNSRSLDVKTDLEIDKLKGMVKAIEAELAKKTTQQVETTPTVHRCGQVVKAVKKIERRVANVEDYLSKESAGGFGASAGQSPPASYRSSSTQIGAVLSKLEDRLAEIEREQLNYSTTNRRVAEVVVIPRQKRVKTLEDRSKGTRESEARTLTPKHFEAKDDSMRQHSGKRQGSTLSYQQDSSLVHGNEFSMEMPSALYDPPAADNVAYLQERIARIEKLRLHKQAYAFKTEAQIRAPSPPHKVEKGPDLEPTHIPETSYMPGNTETLVMHAIAEKSSKAKMTEKLHLRFGGTKALSPLSASFNSLANYSAAQSPKNSASTSMIFRDEVRYPSEELQEHLKLRGFQIKDPRRV